MKNDGDLERELDTLGLLEKAKDICSQLGQDAAISCPKTPWHCPPLPDQKN